jgi:hypothetical protein
MQKKRSKKSDDSIPKYINMSSNPTNEKSDLLKKLKLSVLDEVYTCSQETEIQEDLIYPNGFYTGEILQNQREGLGIFFSTSQFTYHGFWKNDKPDGPGVLKTKQFTYEGFFANSMFDGFGIYENEDYLYKGYWVSNKRVGECEEFYKTLDIKFTGKYKDDIRQGSSTLEIKGNEIKARFKNGKFYKGKFKSRENGIDVKLAMDMEEGVLKGDLKLSLDGEMDMEKSIEFLYKKDEVFPLQYHLITNIP